MTAAAHFGLTLGEMLRIGENLLSGRIVPPSFIRNISYSSESPAIHSIRVHPNHFVDIY